MGGAPYLLPELGELLLDASCFAAGLHLNRHRPPPPGGPCGPAGTAHRPHLQLHCAAFTLLFSRDTPLETINRKLLQPSRWSAGGREPGLGAWVDAYYTSESRPSDRQSEPVPTWSEPASGEERHAPVADSRGFPFTPSITAGGDRRQNASDHGSAPYRAGEAATLPHAQPCKACAAGPRRLPW